MRKTERGRGRSIALQVETLEMRSLMSADGLTQLPRQQVLDLPQQQVLDAQDLYQTTWAANGFTGLNSVRSTYGFTGAGQTVAVIDSGIAYDHAALGGGFGTGYRVVGGWDFTEENDANPYDDGPNGSHGTHVAGIIGSSNGTNQGVAPGVDLVSLRVFNDSGAGNFDWVEQALRWVHSHRGSFANPITTVNLSVGVDWNSNTIPNWANLEDEFAQLEADGIFIAVAAGNSFSQYNAAGLSYPAASSYVVPVASVEDDGSISSFSQRNERVIAAPGRSIVSTVPDYRGNQNGRADDFLSFSGTSMAAPYVAGASVLIRQALAFAGQTNVNQDTIYDWMRNTADTVFDPVTGQSYFRLNVQRAIDSIMPADDFGSDATAAQNLGALTGNRTVSGAFARAGDMDYFRFTASQSGQVTVTANSAAGFTPNWQLAGGAGTVSGARGETFTFNVTAGQSYTFGIGAGGTLASYNLNVLLGSSAGPNYNVAVGAEAGEQPRVRVLDALTGAERFSFFAYDPAFRGGVRVAMGDVNGDGTVDIITAAGTGGGPHVRVFDGNTGRQLAGAIGSFFAYDAGFKGGVFVAAGDLDGDGKADIVTGADAGGGPHVRAFSGATGGEIAGFFAYAGAFAGGVRVAVGDVDGDNVNDIITGAGAGGGPHVRVFSGTSGRQIAGANGSFFAYAANYTGGVFVAAGDVNGDGRIDIVTGAGAGAGGHVRAFNGRTGSELAGFYAFDASVRGGARVATTDIDGDGRAEIVAVSGAGTEARVRTFRVPAGTELSSIAAAIPGSWAGGFVAGRSAAPSVTTSVAIASLGYEPDGVSSRDWSDGLTIDGESGARLESSVWQAALHTLSPPAPAAQPTLARAAETHASGPANGAERTSNEALASLERLFALLSLHADDDWQDGIAEHLAGPSVQGAYQEADEVFADETWDEVSAAFDRR